MTQSVVSCPAKTSSACLAICSRGALPSRSLSHTHTRCLHVQLCTALSLSILPSIPACLLSISIILLHPTSLLSCSRDLHITTNFCQCIHESLWLLRRKTGIEKVNRRCMIDAYHSCPVRIFLNNWSATYACACCSRQVNTKDSGM